MKEETKKLHYKVVSVKEDNSLHSCVQFGKAIDVTYKIGKWVKPNPRLLKIGYGLTVFSSLKRARDFKKEFGKLGVSYMDKVKCWAIYSCEVETDEKPNNGPLGIRQFETLLDILNRYESIFYTVSWPQGTILCSKVKLLEEKK